MRFGLDVPTTGVFADPRLLAELAAEAEQAGWDGFFIWDLLLGASEHDQAEPVADPWIALAAITLATGQLLEPDDVRQVAEFVKHHRPDNRRFDIAVNPKPSASTDLADQA